MAFLYLPFMHSETLADQDRRLAARRRVELRPSDIVFLFFTNPIPPTGQK